MVAREHQIVKMVGGQVVVAVFGLRETDPRVANNSMWETKGTVLGTWAWSILKILTLHRAGKSFIWMYLICILQRAGKPHTSIIEITSRFIENYET